MTRLLAILLVGCATSPLGGDVIIRARSPIIVRAKVDERAVCAVAVEHDGRTVVFWGDLGCGVVHRTVVVPWYEEATP